MSPQGFSEVDIFRVLGILGDLRRGGLPVVKQAVEDRPHQHLKGRRGGKARARQHLALHIGVKAREPAAQGRKLRRHSPDQRQGGVVLRCFRLQIMKLHPAQWVALGLDPYFIGAVQPHGGHRVHIHRRRQHMAPLMVRVVSADLRAARCGKVPDGPSAEGLLIAPVQCLEPLGIGFHCHKRHVLIPPSALCFFLPLPYTFSWEKESRNLGIFKIHIRTNSGF